LSDQPDLAAAIDRAYEQKLRAGRAFHDLQVSRRASRRSLDALATEFSRVVDLLREAAALLPQHGHRGPDQDE
jgi:hypothetical protein